MVFHASNTIKKIVKNAKKNISWISTLKFYIKLADDVEDSCSGTFSESNGCLLGNTPTSSLSPSPSLVSPPSKSQSISLSQSPPLFPSPLPLPSSPPKQQQQRQQRQQQQQQPKKSDYLVLEDNLSSFDSEIADLELQMQLVTQEDTMEEEYSVDGERDENNNNLPTIAAASAETSASKKMSCYHSIHSDIEADLEELAQIIVQFRKDCKTILEDISSSPLLSSSLSSSSSSSSSSCSSS